MNHKKNAFTMLELIFAIVIIGVLSAVALPNFFDMKFKADFAKFESEVKAIQQKIQNKKTENIFMTKLESYNELGINLATKKVFTNLFEDGLNYGSSKGWINYAKRPLIAILTKKEYKDYTKDKGLNNPITKTETITNKLTDGIEFYYIYTKETSSFDCAYFVCKGCSDKRKKLLEKLSNECTIKEIL